MDIYIWIYIYIYMDMQCNLMDSLHFSKTLRPVVALSPAARNFEKPLCCEALRPDVALPPAVRHFGK